MIFKLPLERNLTTVILFVLGPGGGGNWWIFDGP
jgi:hypothetical protein